MQRNVLETIAGAIVLLAAIGFLWVIYSGSGVRESSGGYHLVMMLDRGGTVGPGTDVRAAGVKVGTVVRQEFLADTFQAKITLNVDSNVKISTDGVARITSDGLLGSNYVELETGAEDAYLKDGETVKKSFGALSLTDLLNTVVGGTKE